MKIFTQRFLVKRLLNIFAFLVFSVYWTTLQAEGSRDLYPSGASGYRAYLLSVSNNDQNFNPFSTPGTIKVWVKPGETIYVGSSVQGKSSASTGTINLRTPNGTSYTSGTSTTVGLIANRTQELNGPNRSGVTNGYTPYTRVVGANEGGIWEIDFVAQGYGTNISSSSAGSGTDRNYTANANWVQESNTYSQSLIAAWDVSVGSASNPSTLISGRAFTTLFAGTAPNTRFNERSFYAKFYVLTPEGNAYLVDNNGQNGASFNFFSNNKGPVNLSTGVPTYKSINASTASAVQAEIWDPRKADSASYVTNKLFFNKPASDLPATAPIRYNGGVQRTTWLKNTPITPTISNFKIVGRESGELSSTVGPQGAIISFTSNVDGTYRILIDINNNGSYEDAIDVIIIGYCEKNVLTQVVWDGKNGDGNSITKNSTIKIRGAVSISEIHFPYSDVESNLSGVIIRQLNSTTYDSIPGKDIVYWNDENITTVSNGNPTPVNNSIEGRKSSVNGHIWGTTSSNAEAQQFGNNRTINTWTYLESEPALVTTAVQKFVVDVAVNSVTPSKNSVSMCGDSLTYTIEVENKTSATAIDPANGARFEFKYPEGLEVYDVTYTPTVGSSNMITNSGLITNTKYTSYLNLASGAKGVFTIKVRTNTLLYQQTQLNVSGAVIRPSDYEDVDATDNTTTTGPLDALVECNGLPSGVGCNNILYNSSVNTIFCSTAKLDKSSNLKGLYAKGDTIIYTVKYINTDPYAHLGINISDTLPNGVTLVPNSIAVTTTTPYNSVIRQAYTTSGTTAFTVPSGVTSLTVEAWGGGAGGSTRSNTTNQGGGGGGGGAYSKRVISVSTNQIYNATVGAGGTSNTSGGDSYLRLNGNTTNLILAKGGSAPPNNSANSGIGGLASAGIGDVKYNGGNGAAGNNPANSAGGGGSSASSSAPGINAIGQFGAVSGSNGGNGGRGAGAGSIETPVSGSNPGGGGGGGYIVSSSNNKGAASGGTGQIVINYTSTNNPGTIGSFPNVANNWNVNANEEVTLTYRVVVNQAFNGDSIRNVARATSTYVTTPIYDTVVNYRKINLTGNILNDTNGLTDQIVNGSGLGNPSNTTLFVHLVDSTNKVIAVVPANTNGSYSFNNINTGNYSIYISTQQTSVNSTAITSQLPINWVSTGENIGTQLGQDGTINGSTPVTVSNKDISNINFGINIIPSADTITLNKQLNPGGNTNVSVPSSSFSGLDSNGIIVSIKITSLPTNTTSITVNGIVYTASNFPSEGISIPTLSNGQPTGSILIDPIDGNITSTILYKTIDNAGFESSVVGKVNLPFYKNTTDAVNDENSTWINTPVSGNVTTNDFDKEGNTQNFASFLNQNNSGNPIASGSSISGTDANGNPVANAGTITFGSNGTYTFNPANNFVGNISVPYAICDNGSPVACDTAYLQISVSSLPTTGNSVIANNDEYYSTGNTVSSNVFVNDADPQSDNFTVTTLKVDTNGDGIADAIRSVGSSTTVAGVREDGTPVANAGTLTQNANGTFSFVPTTDFYGTVTYNYTITDNNTSPASDEATVVIKVVRDDNGPLNNPPFAGDDFAYTTVNTPTNGTFASNDSDPNNNPISVKDNNGNPVTIVPGGPKTSINTVTTTEGGTVEFFTDGTYKYTPPTGFTGPDRVVYEICDVTTVNPQPLCAQATIHLLVGNGFSISGNVYNDGNGNTDNLVNPSNGGTNVDDQVYAILTDSFGKVIQSVPVETDGTYKFENVPNHTNFYVLLDTINRNTSDSVTNSSIPTGWVSTGEIYGGKEGHDGIINGKSILISAVNADISDINFGIQRLPIADTKMYNVANTAFEEKDSTDFLYPNIDGFQKFYLITTANDNLTGNGLGGLLTGYDAEDCPNQLDCNIGKRFKFGTSLPSTVVYYNYGGEIGIRKLEEGDFIPNYTAENLIIIAREGSGMSGDPIGFTYSLVDNAGFASSQVSYTIITESALPVELLYFTAAAQDCQVVLSWATASELNNDYFEIEKSIDGINWNTISKLYGKGTTNHISEYQWIDAEPNTSETYYRLKQVDFDGTVEYHSIIEISAEQCHLQLVNIYPNPAKDYIKIQTDIPTQSSISLDIYDMYGRILQREKLSAAWNQISTQNFANGSYLFIIRKGNEILFKHTIIIDK